MACRKSSEDFVRENPVNSEKEKWTILENPIPKYVVYKVKCKCKCGNIQYIDIDKFPIKCLKCFHLGVIFKPNPKPIIENSIVKIPLQGKHNDKFVIFNEDDLEIVKDKKWYYKGSGRTGYAKTIIDGKGWYAHQLLVNSKEIYLDHINNDGLDNRRENLRECSHNQNTFNKTKARGKTSKYYGVSFKKQNNKWRSTLFLDWKQVHSKEFDTELEAALDHDIIAKKLHGKFAKLNFPFENL